MLLRNVAPPALPPVIEDASGQRFWLMPGRKLLPVIGGGAYNNIISRTDAQALIPTDDAQAVISKATEQSAALALFTRIPVGSGQVRIPVLSALPTAAFVTGDTGMKQTTEVNWDDVYMNVEEIATIVPVPENVLADTSYDLWGQVRPLVEEAVARVLDAAIFFGTNKPASWPEAIAPAAIAAGNVVTRGTAAAAAGGVAEDLNQLFALIEADGFDVNGIVAARSFRAVTRGARDTTGQPLIDLASGTVYGATLRWPMRGLWPTAVSTTEAIAGDYGQGVIGVRQDITYKLITEGVITDAGSPPTILYNLPQQDMVALRVVMRVGFAMPNPINYDQPVEASRYPFGVLRRPAA